MANKRIIDLTATTTPSGYVALDHETNGTKKLDVTKIAPVDSALSSSSTNAVQNKVINTALSGKLATNGNSQNNTVAFTSGDVANDAAATSWTANVATLATGLTHANLFNRISTMMKNVRYLYNAVTKLNTDLNAYRDLTITRTENDLLTNDNFGYLSARSRAGVLSLNGNFFFETHAAFSSDWIELGRISGWSAVNNAYLTLQRQNGGSSVVLVEITYAGIIHALSYTGTERGFYRQSCCVIAAN